MNWTLPCQLRDAIPVVGMAWERHCMVIAWDACNAWECMQFSFPTRWSVPFCRQLPGDTERQEGLLAVGVPAGGGSSTVMALYKLICSQKPQPLAALLTRSRSNSNLFFSTKLLRAVFCSHT